MPIKQIELLTKQDLAVQLESCRLLEIERICKTIVKDDTLFKQLGLDFLHYLLNSKKITDTQKLEWTHDCYLDRLSDKEIGRLIFMFLLKIRYEQLHLADIQVYKLYIELLPHCVPSTQVAWQQAMEPFTKNEKLQVKYDDMIQDYLYSSVYPNVTESTRFALFNVLYGSEFEPLQVNQFEFSTAFTKYLPLIHSSEQRRRFALNVAFIESQIDRIQFDVPTFECDLIHGISFNHYDEFDTMLRECLVLLESSHFLYLTTIVFAIIQLFKYAQLHYNVQNQTLIEPCQATWFKRYHQLLCEYAFEPEPDRIHQRLCRLAVCYMQFKRVLSFPHTPFPVAIWDQHYLERSIYLSSINQFNKTNRDALALVEKIVFTTTA